MKKLLQKFTLFWFSLASLVGYAKTKVDKSERPGDGKIVRTRVVKLDEFEMSAFHKN